jgi:hypothetical protein
MNELRCTILVESLDALSGKRFADFAIVKW